MYKLDFKELKLKETESLDSIVDVMTLFIQFQGDRYFYTVNLPDPDPENYIPIEDITDEILTEWFWDIISVNTIHSIFIEREKRKSSTAIKQSTNGAQSYQVRDHVKQWKVGKVYSEGDILYYEWDAQVDTGEVDEEQNPIMETVQYKKFYRVVQGHTSQTSWNPRDTAALFTDIVYFGDEARFGYPDWQQPQGAHDAYEEGRVVKHNGQFWTSLVADNVWEPGTDATLWTEFVEETEEEPEPPTTTEWNPESESYVTGDIVTFNGIEYICIQDHTSEQGQEPDVATELWSEYTEEVGVPEWSGDSVNYEVNDQVIYNGTQYICIQAHTSQVGWNPEAVPSLWSPV